MGAFAVTYNILPSTIGSGGDDYKKSARYLLNATIGQPLIGLSRTANYDLNQGYRQPDEAVTTISIAGPATIDIGTITFTGQATASGTWVVETNAPSGYSLSWHILTGSGGANTGSLISPAEEVIGAYTPAVADTPETWSVASTTSEWGARLMSASTDTNAEWGVDGASEKWLNIAAAPASSRTIVTRGSATPGGGSQEKIAFQVEIGSSDIQPSGTYQATIVITASSL